MNILLTGATGYIGRNLLKKLIEENHLVYVTLRQSRIPTHNYRFEPLYFWDEEPDTIIRFLTEHNIDGIVHLAAIVKPVHGKTDVAEMIDSNVKFGTLLLEYAVAANIKWFINTGTFWQHYQNRAYSPVNLYAATKQAFETIAQYYVETNKIKFVTVKLNDTYGKDDPRNKVFNLWHRIAQTGEVLEMTEGKQVIDISYIDDVVNAYSVLISLLNSGSDIIKNGSIFAVAADKRYELRELAGIFEEVTGKTLNILWGAKPYREREVMVPWSKGNPLPFWKPLVTISEGIKRIFE